MRLTIITALSLVTLGALSCQVKRATPSTPNADIALPDSLLSKVPVNLVSEHNLVFGAIAERLANGDKTLEAKLNCSKGHDKDAIHCLMSIRSPEVELKLNQFFFNLGRGTVVLSPKSSGVSLNFRTYDEKINGKIERVMEYCAIKGVLAVVGLSYGVGEWKMNANVEGLKLVLVQTGSDARGEPQFAAKSGNLDVGALGNYPSQDCAL